MSMDKVVNAKIIISADINLNIEIKKKIEEEYGKSLTDVEAAEYFLFAFLNPKVFSLDEEDKNGEWDGVATFKNRINKLELELF